MASESKVGLLVPVRSTTNVTLPSNAVMANASVVCLLTLSSCGATELLQALLSPQLSSLSSSFSSYPISAVLLTCTTVIIVHPVL